MSNPTVHGCYVLFWDTCISLKISKNDVSTSQILIKFISGYHNLCCLFQKTVETRRNSLHGLSSRSD